MKLQRQFTTIDAKAVIAGGNDGGAFLEDLGRYNLQELSEEEWADFCRAVVGGYRASLQNLVAGEAPLV